nr:DNA cytosine methyltransferase [Moraxella sp.]
MTKNNISPKIISLFSGCGGLDLGFHQEGYETVWANDFDHWACESFRKNIADVIIEGDIEKIDPYTDNSIPECDLVLGGFPCQDFSMIWKRPGLDGERGNLYKSFLRFVDAKKPKVFVAENVKGLLTANNKKAIKQIISDFENIAPGYNVKFHLYNFADYGVPQLRERLLIVGIRSDIEFDFEHPKPTHAAKDSKLLPHVTAGEALSNIPNDAKNNEHQNITASTIEKLKMIPAGGNFTDIPKDHPLYVKGMISHVYRRIHPDEPSKTIIAAGGGGTWGYHYPEPRSLTNRERARLQSFPDDFEFVGTISQVRKQIGNAVPPQGVRELAKVLKPIFNK